MFIAFYDEALPHVYGYLSARCKAKALTEDLTAETFLSAVDAIRRDDPPAISVSWIIGVARHKLADHWRRQARHERSLTVLSADPPTEDSWDARLDSIRARETLELLAPQHRAALTLRYLDDLPVAEVASVLGRTLHATEALLVRARIAFRHLYEAQEPSDA